MTSTKMMEPTRIVRAFAALWLTSSVAQAVDVVAVCPVGFQDALTKWIDHRSNDGMRIEVIDSRRDSMNLGKAIKRSADKTTRYVVLIGDAPVMGQPCNPFRQVPTHYRPTTVSAKYGSTPTLATDLAYGDFDDDSVPDAVVGRMPVDTPAELSALIDRIIAHETSCDFGPWRNRVNLIGGIGGFGPMIDSTIETATRTIVTGVLPVETETTIAHASPGHRFFPKRPFTDAVIDRYRQGARFWVYAGHGHITELDCVPARTGTPILDCQSVKRLQRPAGAAPIAMMLACFSGAVDGRQDSLAEEMIRCDGGPIAVLAGSRVTMPYGNATAAVKMIDAVYTQRAPRLGNAWLQTLQALHQEETPDRSTTQVMIDAMASLFSPRGTKLVDERREHMLLYNLIGDPTLRLRHPEPMVVQAESGYEAGQPIEVSATSPIRGRITVSIDRPIGGGPAEDPNRINVAEIESEIHSETATDFSFQIPADVTGPLVIRARVAGESQWATGATRTIVR